MIRFVFFVLIAVFFFPQSSFAEKRIALVIGNGNYEKISSLKNARNDAALMANTLRDLDFDVVEALEVDRVGMARAVRSFGAKLREAGEDAIGLFYYAGHGVQARGVNYMVPVSASIDTESDLEVEALPTDSVLSQMRDAGNATSIIILDACRNNPFASKTRSGTRGLARLSATGGAIVAFSAAPGQVASDGDGDNSPYTLSLTKAMQADGLTIEQVFKRVLVDVENATGGDQVPWVESSLRDDFYFRPAAKVAAPHQQLRTEAAEWAKLRGNDDPAALQGFIAEFPESAFADLARMRLDTLGRADVAPAGQQLAALSSASSAVQDVPAMAPEPPAAGTALGEDAYREMQAHLNRLGCPVGAPDGKWGRRSEQGLAKLRLHAARNVTSSGPDAALLATLRGLSGRICPPECSILEREENGACVARTCPAGQNLSSKGVCYTPATTATRPGAGDRPKGGRNCWTLIDEVICE